MLNPEGLHRGVSLLLHPFRQTLLAPGSSFSLVSLACAVALAALRLVALRRARGRRIRSKLLVRILFPGRIWFSASTRTDIGFLLFNAWLYPILFGWALISAAMVSGFTASALATLIGPSSLGPLHPTAAFAWLVWITGTLTAYLAYEFGYWIDHYLSHRIPVLWSFHKVHHTAEVLTPLTVFRVHPIESIKLANILALAIGLTGGITQYLFSSGPHQALLVGQNAILLVFILSIAHLQHSHAWICFDGWRGRLFLSPAHHQIHHSADPDHFGKNLGSFLGLWDWVFGTLHVPTTRRPLLRFGVPGVSPHSTVGGLLAPFADAFVQLVNSLSRIKRALRRQARRRLDRPL